MKKGGHNAAPQIKNIKEENKWKKTPYFLTLKKENGRS